MGLVTTWAAHDTNIWKATLASDPYVVYLNGTLGTEVGTIAGCNGANKWHWASNVLYVYSTSDPDTAYVAPGIYASTGGERSVTLAPYMNLK